MKNFRRNPQMMKEKLVNAPFREPQWVKAEIDHMRG